jgi:hypothetical protein
LSSQPLSNIGKTEAWGCIYWKLLPLVGRGIKGGR